MGLKTKLINAYNLLYGNYVIIPRRLKEFNKEAEEFKQQIKDLDFPVVELCPMINDKYQQAGDIDGHYFLQDIYIAKKIAQSKVKEHYDIGSRVDGFISHLLCFEINVTVLDIRPLPQKIENMNFIEADATNLVNIDDCSISSISALHSLEHFGLGRYGDPIDPDSWKKAMKAMQRVLKKGGYLYVSVPISNDNAIYFNSHRVYNPKTVVDTFNELNLVEFSYIKDYCIKTVGFEEFEKTIEETTFGKYDCGMFIFKKLD